MTDDSPVNTLVEWARMMSPVLAAGAVDVGQHVERTLDRAIAARSGVAVDVNDAQVAAVGVRKRDRRRIDFYATALRSRCA